MISDRGTKIPHATQHGQKIGGKKWFETTVLDDLRCKRVLTPASGWRSLFSLDFYIRHWKGNPTGKTKIIKSY